MKLTYLTLIIGIVLIGIVGADMMIRNFNNTLNMNVSTTEWHSVDFKYHSPPICVDSLAGNEPFCLYDSDNTTLRVVINSSGYHYSINGYAVDRVDYLGDGAYYCFDQDSFNCGTTNSWIHCYEDGGYCYYNGIDCKYDDSSNALDMSTKKIIFYTGSVSFNNIVGWIDQSGDTCYNGTFVEDL